MNNSHLPNCSGSALVLVLWLTVILTFVSSMAFSAARTEVRLTKSTMELLKGKALAEAGIWLAIRDATRSDAADSTTMAGQALTIEFDETPITIEMQDVAARINLNFAPRELISKLLASTLLDSAEAERISYLIADWIDTDSDSVVSINEASPYREHGLNYSPRNRPFVTVDELRLVAGLTDPVYREIEPFLTTYGSHSYLNSVAAAPELVSRITATDPDNPDWESLYFSTNPSSVIEITSTVQINDSRIDSSAIVELRLGGRAGTYRILAWNR